MFPLILDSKEQLDNWSTYGGYPEYGGYWVPKITIIKDDLLELIELGANLSETSGRGDNFIHLAAFQGWQEAVEKLNKVDETMMNAENKDGRTPLMYAARGENSGMVRFLLEQGANPKIVNIDGWNILHYSCFHEHLEGNHLFIFTYP